MARTNILALALMALAACAHFCAAAVVTNNGPCLASGAIVYEAGCDTGNPSPHTQYFQNIGPGGSVVSPNSACIINGVVPTVNCGDGKHNPCAIWQEVKGKDSYTITTSVIDGQFNGCSVQ